MDSKYSAPTTDAPNTDAPNTDAPTDARKKRADVTNGGKIVAAVPCFTYYYTFFVLSWVLNVFLQMVV